MSTNTVGLISPFTQRFLGPAENQPVVLDAVIEENVRHDATVTRHPVEAATRDGIRRAEIADHVVLEPDTYTMRGVVSDFPITWRQVRDPYAESSAETRSISAYQLLRRHQRTREPFDVEWGLGILKNMVIESLQVPRSARNRRAIEFTAELVEVPVVVPRALKREKEPEDVSGEQAKARAVSEKNQGEAATKEVSFNAKYGQATTKSLGAAP